MAASIAITARRIDRMASELIENGEASDETLAAVEAGAGPFVGTLVKLLVDEHRAPHAERAGLIQQARGEIGERLSNAITKLVKARIEAHERGTGSRGTAAPRSDDPEGGPMVYAGVWREGTRYERNAVCTHAGVLWFARAGAAEGERPGKVSGWQMMHKSIEKARRTA